MNQESVDLPQIGNEDISFINDPVLAGIIRKHAEMKQEEKLNADSSIGKSDDHLVLNEDASGSKTEPISMTEVYPEGENLVQSAYKDQRELAGNDEE